MAGKICRWAAHPQSPWTVTHIVTVSLVHCITRSYLTFTFPLNSWTFHSAHITTNWVIVHCPAHERHKTVCKTTISIPRARLTVAIPEAGNRALINSHRHSVVKRQKHLSSRSKLQEIEMKDIANAEYSFMTIKPKQLLHLDSLWWSICVADYWKSFVFQSHVWINVTAQNYLITENYKN